MARVEVVKPYIHQLLKDMLGTEGDLHVDSDGDVPIRRGSTMYWISLYDNNNEAQVRVWSYMARGVPASPELYEHLNDINAHIRYGRVYFWDGAVIVSNELLAEGLDARELENACECISGISDGRDDELVAKFGGEVFFAETPDEDAEAEADV